MTDGSIPEKGTLPTPPKRIRDTADLRNFLLEQMVAVATGRLDLMTARHITNFAQQIYNTLNVEVKASRLPKPILPISLAGGEGADD